MGSIFRTADAVGVKKVYLCGVTPAPLDSFGKLRPQLVKVSLGAEKTMEWERAKSISRLIDRLKKEGFKIFAIEQDKKSIPYHKVRVGPKSKVALILGSETKGLSPSILKKADKIIEIPMAGKKESLNVAVAFGIVAFGIKHR